MQNISAPSQDDPTSQGNSGQGNQVVPSDGTAPGNQNAWLDAFKATLKTAERVAFILGLGWFLNEHFTPAMMEEFVTPLAFLLNSIGFYLLGSRNAGK